MASAGPLIDTFGRTHDNLRISITDRCNIRCFYCMPEKDVQFVPRSEVLDYEEIERFARVAVGLGIRKVRITGGEPLVRRDLPVLVRRLAALPGIEDLALTTNGVLLAEMAAPLFEAGLRRINVHLDTLDRERFLKITRRDELGRVLAGIEEARRLGYGPIKLNAVAVKDLVEPDIVPLARYARENGFEVRYIEFMPLDAQRIWDRVEGADGGRDSGDAAAGGRAARGDPGRGPARSGARIPLHRWRWAGGVHRVGEPAVLPQLQPHPADRGREAALLPVRDRGDGREGAAARGRAGRGDRGGDPPYGGGQVGRARDQHANALWRRRGPCIRSGASAAVTIGA